MRLVENGRKSSLTLAPRAEKNLQHYRTIQALPLILGAGRKVDADFLDSCRSKRNIVEYDRIGTVSTAELGDLVELVKELRDKALKWLRVRHRELLSPLIGNQVLRWRKLTN